ncbi:MAG TPA: S8 family serine peptidase [Oscillatoriaceae cyanobacterium M33_DOE_052]|uniref:Peptidase S8 n=1 Tax=Planktothricoides sp. SpSt-374 TaxID=2282167 RepID=A0A7C3VJI8_9CYAN|nr:S8 family serine peptidase [Oscillatoriaceae cyanobacterium M33_DOE_052]
MKKIILLGMFVVGLIWAIASYSGLATQGTYNTIVLDFREDIPAAEIQNQLKALAQNYQLAPRLNSEFSQADNLYIVRGDAAATPKGVQQLLQTLKRSEVAKYTEYIEPDFVYSALGVPNDPDYHKQWNLRSINAEKAWEDTAGSGVTVAVIDTGISRVPDLKDTKFVKGYDFVNDNDIADDDNGHGTHVAGTIAQTTNNGYGVAGVAYQASLMPLKVLSASGGGTVADIAEAIKFAADNGADVINMSLGGGGESQVMKEAIAYAHNKGVVIIAAAGNSGENSASYPARYTNVIGVSALGPTSEKAPYSNFGAGVDISAPGGDKSESEAGGILQNTIDPNSGEPVFAYFQGTSMAAPHVAGVAALVKASGVSDPEQITQILLQSARTVKEDPLNHFGAGQLDAANAVALATKGQITFRDFFRWLRDNGYLNPRFWIDGGAYALLPKLAMVLGSYLLAWFLRNYFPFGWSWNLTGGLVAGSSGLFVLRGLYIFDLPQAPFRVMGSSIPELGTAIGGTSALNPIFASVLIPAVLVVLLLGNPKWKWFAIGSALGVASCLAVSAVVSPSLLWVGSGMGARAFLVVNALLCFALARLAVQDERQTV